MVDGRIKVDIVARCDWDSHGEFSEGDNVVSKSTSHIWVGERVLEA
jgi:hypothetical protein